MTKQVDNEQQTSKDWRSLPRPKRWSARRKKEIVLRILRGEPLDTISREVGVPIYTLEDWQKQALEGIEASLKIRENDPLVSELGSALKRVGELSMENELLRERCRKQGPFQMGRWKR